MLRGDHSDDLAGLARADSIRLPPIDLTNATLDNLARTRDARLPVHDLEYHIATAAGAPDPAT